MDTEFECDDDDVKEKIRSRLSSLISPKTPSEHRGLEKRTKPDPKEIHPVEQRMKKVRVAVAMDTGAMTNASPNGVFGTKVKHEPSAESLYGADNVEILNLGTQMGKGTSGGNDAWQIEFDIAKFSRPLGSVSKMLNITAARCLTWTSLISRTSLPEKQN